MGTQKESAEKQLAAPAADDRLSVYHRFTAAGADAVLGQMLADRLNAGNKTIAFQQSLFLNAFALIEFFKALLRLSFARTCRRCALLHSGREREILGAAPERAQRPDWLRPAGCRADHLQPGERQFGALANVIIMLCITVWSLYLIFHNKKTITESLLHLADRSLSSLACLFAPSRWCGTGWQAPTSSCCASSRCSTRQQPEIYDGGDVQKPGDYRHRGICVGAAVALDSKTITLSPQVQRNYPELQNG
jgi:hypothetical protein